MALSSAEKLARAIQRMNDWTAQVATIDDYLSILASGQTPRLTFATRPGDHYDLGTNQTQNILTADRATLVTKITDMQSKVDQAAAITG